MADRITIDIAILQGVFGDLTKLQQQLGGLTGGVAAVDGAAIKAFGGVQQSVRGAQGAVAGLENGVDAGMRNIVADIMAPVSKTQELEEKLRRLGTQVRTSKSVGEITKLKKEIHATQRELDGVNPGAMERKVGGAAQRMRGMFGSLAAPLVGAFAVTGLTAFAGDLAKAAGAQQQFDASLTNMLQSKGKADALAAQVKSFAATTPFELPEVQDATKKMLAFGFGSEETIPTLRRLGDVAAGLGQPVGDLAYLYGTTRVQGRLYTNDLMQFANRGIPIIEELSKVLGVSQSEVKSLVEKGKVGFPQVEKVFANLTAEGSKFGGLMEAQSHTITGQISNLSDAWGQFKADMGLAMAPLITGVIGGLSGGIGYLRDTFEWVKDNGGTILSVFKGVSIAVGIYTSAMLVNNAALIANNALQLVAAVRMGALGIVTNLVTSATTIWTGVQWALNAALTANPIGLVVVAIAALVGGIIWAYNNFEGFRGVVHGVWEVMKGAFNWILDFAQPVITGLIELFNFLGDSFVRNWDMLISQIQKAGIWLAKFWDWTSGFRDLVVEAFAGLVDVILLPFKAAIDLLSKIPGVDKLVAKAKEFGTKVGTSFSKGQELGIASFNADLSDPKVAKSKTATPGLDASALVPGQNVGAAGLVGGQSATGTGTKSDGVTVSGDKGGSGRTITMNIKLENHFSVAKDGIMDVRDAAETLAQQLFSKLNDGQYAIG